MGKKPKDRKIVKIKVYKGDQILLKQDGTISNEFHYIRTRYGTNEWKCLMKHLKHLKHSGYCEVYVEGVQVISGDKIFKLNESEISSIKKEVKDFFNFKTKQHLSPEQKEIKELREKLDNLLKNSNKTQELNDSDQEPEEKTEMQLLRSEYFNLAGKRCSPKWDKETLEQKIQGLKT